jgi:hypothetical protein
LYYDKVIIGGLVFWILAKGIFLAMMVPSDVLSNLPEIEILVRNFQILCNGPMVLFSGYKVPFLASESASLLKYSNQRVSRHRFVARK